MQESLKYFLTELFLYFLFWVILSLITLMFSKISMNVGNGSFKNKTLILKILELFYACVLYIASIYIAYLLISIGKVDTNLHLSVGVFVVSYIVSISLICLAYKYGKIITKPLMIFYFILQFGVPVYAFILIRFWR